MQVWAQGFELDPSAATAELFTLLLQVQAPLLVTRPAAHPCPPDPRCAVPGPADATFFAPLCRGPACVQACGSAQVVAPEDVEAEDVDSLKRLATKQVTQVRHSRPESSPLSSSGAVLPLSLTFFAHVSHLQMQHQEGCRDRPGLSGGPLLHRSAPGLHTGWP